MNPGNSRADLPWPWPEAASTAATQVDHVALALLAASAGLVVVLVLLNLIFLIRYRRGSRAPRPPLGFSPWKLEACWITGTTVGFLGFYAWGAPLYLRMNQPPPGAEVIRVIGRQWMWDIRQPNGRREFDSLHVPLGQAVRLRMTSEDVIHSFYVPAFRVKEDVVPGKETSLWFTATKTGSFKLFCSEFCGSKHAEMIGEVVVQTPEAYAAWLAQGTPTEGARLSGRGLFVRYGCAGCHAPGAAVHAPLLEGVYGSRVPVSGGGFVSADEAYLRDSILLPNQVVVAGYAPIMPSYQGVIPEGELLDLISYLKTLGPGDPGSALPLSP